MDTGVGFFVISNGMVVKTEVDKKVSFKLVTKALISNIPLVILGFIRVFSIEKLDYQKHISEYGIHWNFFFTLAAVKFISSVLITLWPRRTLLMSITISIGYECLLGMGLQEWALSSSPRNDFITANREGILSLPGYISLYIASVYLGSKFMNKEQNCKSDIQQTITIFYTFGFLFVTMLVCYNVFDVSRRLMNITYVLWMMTLSVFYMGVLVIVETTLVTLFIIKNIGARVTPMIFDAVNYNGLLFFLLANIFTGIVNMTYKTLYIPTLMSLVILFLYMLSICSIMFILYVQKVRIKVW
jgi:hypothetical protein